MKKLWVVVILVAVGAVLFLTFKTKRSTPEETGIVAPVPGSNPPSFKTSSNQPSVASDASALKNSMPALPGATMPGAMANVTPTASAPVAPTPESASLPPATILDNMRITIHSYGLMFGGNPVGTNPEITRALSGDNPKQVNFLKADGNRVNANGELVDAWGTPYFFHQISGTDMEIHSAGPDKIMWTTDDLVTH